MNYVLLVKGQFKGYHFEAVNNTAAIDHVKEIYFYYIATKTEMSLYQFTIPLTLVQHWDTIGAHSV